LNKLSEEPTHNFALVLTPTHELAHQIGEQFLVAGAPMSLRVCVISGGTDQILESMRLQNRPHIVVAVPGRLAAHLTGCNTFSFESIKYLVIDEADRVLSGSFDETLEVIERFLPKERQNLFFSATMKEFLKESSLFPIADDVFEWTEDMSVKTVDTLDQRYVLCADYDRDMVLVEVLRKFKEDNPDANVIIFTNKKKDCQVLSIALNSVGLENVCLHGFMRQKERVATLGKFKSNIVKILICTDVASRGLDIPNVQLVLNHRLPKFANEYVHRVGRTARQGRSGLAISIFRFPRDLEFLAEIESLINTKLTEHKIDQRLVERIFMQVSMAMHQAESKVDNDDFDERIQNYRRKRWIQNGLDPDEEERKWQKELKRRIKERKAARKESYKSEKVIPKIAVEDERFKNVEVKEKKKFVKKDLGKLKKLKKNLQNKKKVSL
jgi:ATP-dependent RNA helicase DDX49/DBP8